MSVRLSVLDNGLRVLTQTMDHVETVSLGVWIGSGTRHESTDAHGISHLLEHMAFKGTERRTAQAIAEEIESVGGELNAATSAETTAYYARILKQDTVLALDILSDILLHATFDERELEREKSVILQEIAATEDSPDDVVCDLVQETAFPAQPLGRTILGTPESVTRIGRPQLKAHLDAHYGAPGMVLAAAGAVDHEDFVRKAEDLFGGLSRRSQAEPERARYRGGVQRSMRDFEQSHIIVAYAGPSYREDEDYYRAQVLSGLIGGGMSSRLFQEAREKRGLCYAIYAFHWGYSDTGLFGVHAATGPELLDELTDVVAQELRRAADERAPEAEVARVRAQLKAGLLMSLESSSARAQRMARQMLAVGRTIDANDLIARIESVTPENIRVLAEETLAGSRPTVASVGGPKDLGAVERLAHKFVAPRVAAAE